ncbi:unnamed protein product [Timema podura]|uniref:Uncharacterized protein n=1 Tax=Timema podura TaxID=61482 RepID=A0ABN7PH21_TIMPD|nr:unnamed protein product [Timema podura]
MCKIIKTASSLGLKGPTREPWTIRKHPSSFYDDDREMTGSYTSSPPMQGLTITSSTAAMADLSSSLRLNQAAAASRTRYNFGSEISIRPIVEIKKEPGQPFPLSASRVGAANHSGSSDDFNFKSPEPKRRCMPTQNDNEVSGLLRQLLDVEREHLELEKQRLEFDRMVGTQLLALVPMVGVNSDHEQLLKSNESPARESLSSDDLSEDTEASCDGSEVNALSGTANAEKTECLEKLKDADIENGERNFPEIIESEDDITFLENC